MTFVYELRFPSGKRYIGITADMQARWRGHLCAALSGSSLPVARAIRKYGAAAVVRRILLTCSSRVKALKSERQLIRKFKTLKPGGYNVTPGGEDSPALLEEVRLAISRGTARRWLDPAYRRRALRAGMASRFIPGQKAWNKGKCWSAETRAKMAAAKLGTHQSEKTKRKRARFMRTHWRNSDRRARFVTLMTGRRWATDGKRNLQLRRGAKLPRGCRYGFLQAQQNIRALVRIARKRGREHSKEMLGRRQINNGLAQRLVHLKNGQPPKGWRLGVLSN